MMEYRLIVEVEPRDFNLRCAQICEEGYEPYGEPFVRTGYKTVTPTNDINYLPVFCQAFVRSTENS